jgi:hypothetical protein
MGNYFLKSNYPIANAPVLFSDVVQGNIFEIFMYLKLESVSGKGVTFSPFPRDFNL